MATLFCIRRHGFHHLNAENQTKNEEDKYTKENVINFGNLENLDQNDTIYHHAEGLAFMLKAFLKALLLSSLESCSSRTKKLAKPIYAVY